MAVLHMSEAEVVDNIASVLDKVRHGSEIVIEDNSQPVAVIKPSRPGRLISEVILDLKALRSTVAMDEDFARDIEEGVKAHRQPWTPPSWE